MLDTYRIPDRVVVLVLRIAMYPILSDQHISSKIPSDADSIIQKVFQKPSAFRLIPTFFPPPFLEP